MSPIDTTDPSQSSAISFEFELRHSPAKVWRALTDPVLLTEWLLPAVGFELEVGRSFSFNAPPQPGWDGRVRCSVLAVEPPRRLVYSWVVGDGLALETVVTFTLTPTETGTRLSLVQAGFKPHQKQNFGGARYGWRLMGGRLAELLGRLPEEPSFERRSS